MRVRLAVGSACLFLAAACGTGTDPDTKAPSATGSPTPAATVEDEARPAPPAELPSEPEDVIRAWSAALNADDDAAAADLFAPGAIVVQVGRAYLLRTHEEAAAWNRTLPCSGTIVHMSAAGESILVVFSLGDRKSSACDAPPGTLAAARFVVEDGKIQLWAQVAVPDEIAPPGPDPVV